MSLSADPRRPSTAGSVSVHSKCGSCHPQPPIRPSACVRPLRRTDLSRPELVHRDDNITLVFEVPGILLTTRGKALDSGAEGDVISVLNPQSKRTVQGIVSGSGRVTVLSTVLRTSQDTTAAAIPRAVASR